MKTPTEQPKTKTEHTDGGKISHAPKEKLLLEIEHIRDKVRAKKPRVENTVQEEKKATDAKRTGENEFLAKAYRDGKIFAPELLKAEENKPNNPNLELYFKVFKVEVSSLGEYVRAMERVFRELGTHHNEKHAIIMKDHDKDYVLMLGCDRHPFVGFHVTRTLSEDEIKERCAREEKECAKLDEQTALKARVYQNHIHGFSEAAIQLIIDKKRRDWYLELINAITDLLVIKDLQKFHKFNGIGHIVAEMARLIGEFNKEFVKKEQNPRKLEDVQEILDRMHERVKRILTK